VAKFGRVSLDDLRVKRCQYFQRYVKTHYAYSLSFVC